jgi:hypothetical protein
MLQEILLTLSVLAAIVYLVIRFKPAKKSSDCGANCGCEPTKMNPRDASF